MQLCNADAPALPGRITLPRVEDFPGKGEFLVLEEQGAFWRVACTWSRADFGLLSIDPARQGTGLRNGRRSTSNRAMRRQGMLRFRRMPVKSTPASQALSGQTLQSFPRTTNLTLGWFSPAAQVARRHSITQSHGLKYLMRAILM